MKSLGKDKIPDKAIVSVSMLGSNEKITWCQSNAGLRFSVPVKKPCQYAYAYRIVASLFLPCISEAGDMEQQDLSKQSSELLLKQSHEAYTIFNRKALSKALVAKGIDALPELSKALEKSTGMSAIAH